MMRVEDPDYRQLRQEFLEYVRNFHAQHNYSRNWQNLCQVLGIRVVEADQNLYSRLREYPSILVDPAQANNRLLFTGLHELSHYLFHETDDAFAAVLQDRYPHDLSKAFEERLCNEAAALMLFPDHELKTCIRQHGISPETVFALTQRQGSCAAAIVRILQALDFDLWGLILTNDREVEFSWTTTRYSLGRDHPIEDGHPIHDAWHGSVERRAFLPYQSGSRKVRLMMRAGSNGSRVVALFTRRFQDPPDPAQLELFPTTDFRG